MSAPDHPAPVDIEIDVDDRRRLARASSTLPTVAAGHLEVGTLDSRAASLRGEAHVLLHQPRQDAFGLLASDDGRWLVGGVADGLGAEPYSAFGADAAVQAGLAALAAQPLGGPDGPDVDGVVRSVVDAVTARAAELAVLTHAVSTTLTLAAVQADPDGPDRTCWLLSVGDSHALVIGSEGSWTYLTPHDPERCDNVVESHLPDAPGGVTASSARLAPGEVLVLASDGFTVPLGDGTSRLGRHLAERWRPGPRDLLSFVVDLTFAGHHDDRTVLAVWA